MTNKSEIWIGGKHSVESVITKKKRKIFKIVTLKENNYLEENNIKYEIKSTKFFNKIFPNSHIAHQGIAALVSPLPTVLLEDISREPIIVMLDGVTDPMNIGAIIRNCVAFGVQSIIVKDREFNHNSAATIKASSGTIEEINLCKVSNLSNAIKFLKTKNFWISCLENNAATDVNKHKWDDKNVIIFGAEGDGVSQLIKEKCDHKLKIPIHKKVESLNVSSAVAITLNSIYFAKNFI